MIIHCISDLHGQLPKLPGGDLLIVCGDLTYSGKKGEMIMFGRWLDSLPYEEIVVIAGNHDHYLSLGNNPFERAHYLMNSGINLFGINIWGSPFTLMYMNWYFMKNPGKEMKDIWDQIPENTDILVTHGPPYGVLDKNYDDEHCGCIELLHAVERIKPKIHVFGHIHQGLEAVKKENTVFVNCAYVDENYTGSNELFEIGFGYEKWLVTYKILKI